MTILLTLLLMLALLLVKGFFSGSEIALVSTDRIKLRNKAAQGNGGARLAQRLLRDPARLLTTTLLGTNMSSIALTTVGTLLMVELFAGQGELIALIVFTPLFLILGEIVPKSVYQQKANTVTPIIAYPLGWLQIILWPLVLLFSRIAKLAAWMIGGSTSEDTATSDQFLAAVRMAETSGAAEAFSRGQVRNVLRFAQMTAAEAMYPLSEARVASRDADMAELVAIRRESGQRLIPLYDTTPSNITGVAALECWDLIDPDLETRKTEDFIGAVRFVPQLQPVSEIIEMLHAEPATTVFVVDEFGNALGAITLNLLVRGTLGAQTNAVTDRSRSATASDRIVEREEGGYLIDARLPVSQVNEHLDTDLPTLAHSTVGGYALSRFGRLPEEGDSFIADGYTFTVAEADEKRISKLSVVPVT